MKTPIKKLIRDHQIKAKKSLGQNFLVSEEIFSNIANAIKLVEGRYVLEIGPGLGSLTRIILEMGASKVIAIEKDESFLPILSKLETHYGARLKVINDDALLIDEKLLFDDKFIIVANLPYNIATELLFKWFDNLANIDAMFLMFQKEVAERIVGKPRTKAYGKISIITELLTNSKILFDIEPEAFIPPPKITSSFVKLDVRSEQLFKVDIKKLNNLLQNLFNMRRKMLRKSLRMFTPDPDLLLSHTNIFPTQRPEELSLEQFCILANRV